MKKLKKIAVLLVAAISVLGMSVMAEGETELKYSEEVKLLTDLNIISVVDGNDDFSADKAVTREEFCVYLSRAFEFPKNGAGSKQMFTDVDETRGLFPYISSLYDRGIVAGYGGEFRPDAEITMNEAVKMLVAATNYDYTQRIGGEKIDYPSGYIKIANEAGITKGLSVGDNVTKNVAAKLICNALTAPLIELDYVSGNNITFEEKEDETMFSALYNIFEGEGRVLANGRASFVPNYELLDVTKVRIGDEVYASLDSGIDKLLGHYVEFLYRETEDEEYEVIAVTLDDSEEIVLERKDITDFENNTYIYVNEDGKSKTARLDSDYDVMYNFAYPDEGFKSEMLLPNKGKVKLIRDNDSNAYNAVIIEEYKNYVVHSVDASGSTIYTKSKETLPFKNKEITLLSGNGNKIDFPAVKEWNVISVFETADKEDVTIYVSDSVINGSASSTSTDGVATVQIDGVWYEAEDGAIDLVKLGVLSAFYMDYTGVIVTVDANPADRLLYGYLIASGAEEGYENGKVFVRLFTEKGELMTYTLSEKAKINDERFKTEAEMLSMLNVTEKIVLYSTPNAGEISKMYVCDSSTDEFVHKLYDNRGYWNYRQRSFQGKVNVEADPVVFVIPENATREEYEISSLSSFVDDKQATVKVYTFGDNLYGECIVRDTSISSYNSLSAIIKKITTGVYDDGDEYIELECLFNGSTVSYKGNIEDLDMVADKTVAVGDVVRLSLSASNELKDVLLLYDCSEKAFVQSNPYEPQSGAGFRSEARRVYGYAMKKQDGLLRYAKELPATDENTETALLSGFSIYVIDTRKDINDPDIYVGSENDIVDYETAGNDCSRIIVSTNWWNPLDIIVVK